MKLYRATIATKSAFGTLLKGDTLFGQLCWAIVNRFGEQRLSELLKSYQQQPFVICSDGFPSAYIPRPSLPDVFFDIAIKEDRKAMKKKSWIPLDCLTEPISSWLANAKSDAELLGKDNNREQPHNTINRLTGTTGEDIFAPYSQHQIWYQTDEEFDLYLLLDESLLSSQDVETLFTDIGVFGYGRDASIGLGKFECIDFQEWYFASADKSNACLTLAPCAPQGLGLDSKHSYYRVFTRFGRHGDVGVHRKHGPFKAPVLLADTAAVFSPTPADDRGYIGQGLGGAGDLSRTIPATVHQGYSPYIPVFCQCLGQEEVA